MKQFSKDLGNVSLAPKGKWSKEQEYEKLSLVYNACDNLSYVSKIDVPSGVDIENREYWQPMNATGYADNNFINLTTESENGTITAYESLEEAVATILPINRRAGATLSFYNLNSDRLDRQAEFELWQFNSTDLANWENRDYWNNIYYNWNVFVGWYIGADALKNHVKLPTVGQYAYVGSNLNDALLYQCRTNGTWTNTGIKVRNYISVVVSGNITIGDNGNWFSDGEDTGIPATPAVDEHLDNIIMQIQQHTTEINNLKAFDKNLQDQITNLPDNEDLTSVDNGTGNNVLKFKDKTYNPLNYSGMGRKILRKNIVDGVNILTQSMINQANTIYIIHYDFTLGEDITVPSNCILEFDGGSLSNGNIVFDNTGLIINSAVFKNCTFLGEITNKIVSTEWFDRTSYANDLEFLRAVFSLNEGGNGRKEIHIYGEYFPDILDHVDNPNYGINNNKLFLFKKSVTLIGHNAVITAVRNGKKYLYNEVLDGKNRGIFAFNPSITDAEVSLYGLKIDGGVSDELPVKPNQSLTLGRGLVAFRPGYDGINGNFKSIRIENCEFTKSICEVLNGMGMFMSTSYNTVICRNCYFHDTSGSVYNINARSCVENCYFKNVVNGSAIELALYENTVSVIKDCTIEDVEYIASFLTNYGESPTPAQTNSIQVRMVNCNCKNSNEFNTRITSAGGIIYGVSSTGIILVTVDSCRFENYGMNTVARGDISFNNCIFEKGFVISNIYSAYYNHCKFYISEIGNAGFNAQAYDYQRILYNDCIFIVTGNGSKTFTIPIPLSFEGILNISASSDSSIGYFTCKLNKWNGGTYVTINKTGINDKSLHEEVRNFYKHIDSKYEFHTKGVKLSIETNDDVTYTIMLIINTPYNPPVITNGSTVNRPQKQEIGFQYFDATLNKPIWYKGNDVWIDATGAVV